MLSSATSVLQEVVIANLDSSKDAVESVTCGGIEILDLPDENEEDDYNMVGGGVTAAAVVVGWVMLLAHKNKIYHQSSIRNKSSNRIHS